jgi:polyhydroxybutyrate depolymerase
MKIHVITQTLVAALLVVLLNGCFSSGGENAANTSANKELNSIDGRSYLLKLPANYQAQHSYKLLLAFHGSGGNASGMQSAVQLEQYSDDYIVAYPNSKEVEWNEGCSCNIAHRKGVNDLAFVDQVIADIQQKHQITASEIYAAGFSQGGLFTQNLACNRSDVFKAVAIVAAPMSEQLSASCAPATALSVLMVHGYQDGVLPYNGYADFNFGLISSPDAILLHASKHGSLPHRLVKPFPLLGAGVISYTNGKQKFQLYSVAYGGHSWRFADLDTSAKIIEFFATLDQPELPEYSTLVPVGDNRFHVRTMGQENAGPAVVLLAGPNQHYHSDSAWFAALQPLLAQKYRVYSIDRLGNAYSSTAEQLSYRRFADDLAAVLQQLNEQQVVLVAFSSASISARLFYQQYQQQFDLKAMLYIDPDIPLPHSVSLYQGYPANWYLANLPALLPHIASGAWTERTLEKLQQERAITEQLVAEHAELMDWQYYEQISQQRLLIPQQQARASEIAAYSADLDSYAQLPMISAVPVSVIDSDFEQQQIDNAEPEQIAAMQLWQQEGSAWSQEQASLSNGQYIALTDGDHLVPLQQPYQVQQALDWLFAQLQLP